MAFAYVTVLLPLYLLIVRALRYRRRDSFISKYKFHKRGSLKLMSLDNAHAIVKDLAELEFPQVFSGSIFFALFKTYGIPSISGLLVTTGQLSNKTTASKRAADTGVMLTEMVLNEPASSRTIDGIARVNYLHNLYRKSGKISDDDMLYTLGLFALEPIRWVSRFDWRDLTEVEKCALGVFWKDMGEAMEIPYSQLKPYLESVTSDGLSWLVALEAWCLDYEEKQMVPSRTNEQVARATLDIALFNVPVMLHGFALRLISALLETRLRNAIKLESPNSAHKFLLTNVVKLRKWAVRYLCLPRPTWMRTPWFTDSKDPTTGRYHALQYISHPWYIKPSFSSRWNFEALRTRLWRGVLPGEEGTKYHPEGYHISELGPKMFEGKGEEEMENTRQTLRASRGCPMSISCGR